MERTARFGLCDLAVWEDKLVETLFMSRYLGKLAKRFFAITTQLIFCSLFKNAGFRASSQALMMPKQVTKRYFITVRV